MTGAGGTGDTDDRVARRLGDLSRMARLAAGIVAKGDATYMDDGLEGQTLRLAGRQLVSQVATVVEKLPETYKAQHPDVDWVKIQRMRNLVAHHYDKVHDEFVRESLRSRVPDLVARLGIDQDVAGLDEA